MRIGVIGANGQLGSDVCSAFHLNGDEVHAITHADIELTSAGSVQHALDNIAPEFVINAAAMHHVEKCEADPVSAFGVNGIGSRNLADWAKRSGATVAYISTDYVFDGRKQKPYVESDLPQPLNVYGITKLSGEHFTALLARNFVVRVSAIYGSQPCRAKGGLNFVELMLKLASERDELHVVDDEFVTPTPTRQVAQELVTLSRSTEYGLYHATAEGSCSWFEFARAIFEASGVKVRLEKARPGEFPAKVSRPKYSVLENQRLKTLGLNCFSHWRDGLHDYLARRGSPALAGSR